MPTGTLTKTIIEAAITGFEAQKKSIDAQIAELRAMLTGSPATQAEPEPPTPGTRRFSVAARNRMREAQRLRWAKVRGQAEPPAKTPKPKRKLSAAARASLAANLAKARAAKAAKVKSATAKGVAAAPQSPKKKRKLSAAGRAAIIAATKKMWAAKRAAAKKA